MTSDPNIATKLDELIAAIRGYDDPRRAATEWKQVYKLLQKTDLPPDRLGGIVGMRDLARLAETVEQFRSPEAAAPADDADTPDAETLRQAFRAFRKRLAVTRLDDESKLGRGPLSKGSDDTYAAITPPDEWPEAVWAELVRQGKLRYIGHGFYELPKP